MVPRFFKLSYLRKWSDRAANMSKVVVSPRGAKNSVKLRHPVGWVEVAKQSQALPVSLREVSSWGCSGTLVECKQWFEQQIAGYDGSLLSVSNQLDINQNIYILRWGKSFPPLPILSWTNSDMVEASHKQGIPVLATTLFRCFRWFYKAVKHERNFASVMLEMRGKGISQDMAESVVSTPGYILACQVRRSLNVAVAAGILMFSL